MEWLENEGMREIENLLVNLRAKNVSRIYVTNFGFMPKGVNRQELCNILNKDSGDWYFYLEDGDIVAEVKKHKN